MGTIYYVYVFTSYIYIQLKYIVKIYLSIQKRSILHIYELYSLYTHVWKNRL